jgi:hypothetical protein
MFEVNEWIEYDPQDLTTHPKELGYVEAEFENGRRVKGTYSRAAGMFSFTAPISISNPIRDEKVKRWRYTPE